MAALSWRDMPGVRQAGQAASTPVGWSRARLAGRLVELSGRGATAVLTLAVGLVVEAQRESEPVAWIQGTSDSFYPPDLAAAGVDLAALPVIRAGGPAGAARAASQLARSGAFGLLVLDLGVDRASPNPCSPG